MFHVSSGLISEYEELISKRGGQLLFSFQVYCSFVETDDVIVKVKTHSNTGSDKKENT